MKVQVGLVLVVGLLVGADEPTKKDKEILAKEELKKFQGEWVPVAMEVNGKPAPEQALKGLRVTLKGNRATFQQRDKTSQGTFTIDPTTRPKQIGATGQEGGREVKTIGIYEFDGDKLRICYTPVGGPRPTEFSSKRGTEKQPIFLDVLQRAQDQGDKNDKALVPVEGRVTLDGKPLANATVVFVPVDKGGQRATGTTDQDGKYKLTTLGKKAGVRPGRYKVVISKKEGGKVVVPDKYGSEKATLLRIEVPPDGSSNVDFLLVSR
jgi:uncharacterized protein (TIGR03067 family)